ncbi:MAG: hypothetical protein R3260_03455 [Pseudomonas sp.]|nr:hypothetical protein [Pseudomonas sp.]
MTEAARKLTLPKYYAAKPVEYNSYVIGLEKVTDMADELYKLWEAHWAETEVLYLDEPMAPDLNAFVQYEKMGRFVVFTVRTLGDYEMVGNLMYFIGPNTHIKGTTLAKEDAFFLRDDHRNGRLAIKFLEYAETVLTDLNVDYIGMSDKSPAGGKSLAKFMDRRGYRPIAVQYLKKVKS